MFSSQPHAFYLSTTYALQHQSLLQMDVGYLPVRSSDTPDLSRLTASKADTERPVRETVSIAADKPLPKRRLGSTSKQALASGCSYETTVKQHVSRVHWRPLSVETTTPVPLYSAAGGGLCATGASNLSDLVIQYINPRTDTLHTTNVEIKTGLNGTDFVQCKMVWNSDATAWQAAPGTRLPPGITCEYENVLRCRRDEVTLKPLTRAWTYDEWETHVGACRGRACADHTYVDPTRDVRLRLDTIDFASRNYAHKQCDYIQIRGLGLFHTGTDVCGFGVPYFRCTHYLRFRVKVHERRMKATGLCRMSTVASCRTDTNGLLEASPYTLDGTEGKPLPPSLTV